MQDMTNKSISHGTLRTQDLIPAFLDTLRIVDPTGYGQMLMVPTIPAYAMENEEASWWDSEWADSVVQMLIEALDEAAPEGTMFGAHEGDGSDFGFWSY